MAGNRSLRFERSFTLMYLLGAVGIFAVNAKGVTIGPFYDSYSNTNLYLVGTTSTNWADAQAQAVTLGGKLLTVRSAAQDQFIASTFYKSFAGSGGAGSR